MRLNEIGDMEGATHNFKRVGRGIGSGKGKMGGRGHKGQKARSGVAVKGFEGGQMPIHRRLPKRGFTNIFATNLVEVSLGRIQQAIDANKLDVQSVITAESLKQAGVVRAIKDGVRLLNSGVLTTQVTLEVESASAPALVALEKAGCKIRQLRAAKDTSTE